MISHEICICTRGRNLSLLELLDSLAGSKNIEDRFIRIVVNGEKPNPELLQSIDEIRTVKNLNLVVNYSASGLTKARNFALDESTAELITFIDDDISVDKNCFIEIEQFFSLNEKIVGSTPVISGMYSDLRTSFMGRLKLLCIRKNYQGKVSKSGKNFWFIDDGRIPGQTTAMWLPGCCMTYRRSRVKGIRFPEELQNGPSGGYSLGEDVIFSIRAGKFGELHLNPRTRIFHKKAEGIRDNRQIMANALGRFLAYETREESGHVSITAASMRLLCELTSLVGRCLLKPKRLVDLNYKLIELRAFINELKSPILVPKGLKRER